MELSFSELRAKEVINTQDGRKLGKVCDIILCYPDNRWIGLVVPGGRGFGKKHDLFIELKNIVKIGEDVILVNVGFPRKQNCDKRGHGMPVSPPPSGYHGSMEGNGRNFEEYE
ncbi:MAG: YlmC/YmxH family sporulation protein [Clostridiales bacterium]|nr:YlmC/YmxH family sporulation protein [Clostridiales bacterium]